MKSNRLIANLVRHPVRIVLGLLVLAALAGGILFVRVSSRPNSYRVGYYPFPPYLIVQPNGSPAGFAVDIFSEAAKRLRLKIQWVRLAESADKGFAAGQIDLYPILAINEERKKHFHLSPSWWENNLGLLSLAKNPLPYAGQLAGRRIAVLNLSFGEAMLRQAFPKAIVVPVYDYLPVLTSVCNGEADAGVVDTRMATDMLVAGIPECVGKRSAIHLFRELNILYGVASRRELASQADLFQSEIMKMALDGTMASLSPRYGLLPTNQMDLFRDLVTVRDRNMILLCTVGGLSLLLALFFWQNRRVQLARAAAERAQKEAEHALSVRTQFIANVSHEIRTPLNGILGMTELLLGTSLDNTQREFAQSVESSGHALHSMMNQLLDFSKIEAGRMELSLAPFSPLALVEEVSTLFLGKAAERHIEIAALVNPTVPRSVVGDAGRLRQVLSNLMGNAVKFTESGSVFLHATLLKRNASVVTLRFTVEDTGVGIPESFHGRLFQPFSQFDSTSTRRHGGTGLGLAICRELVNLMSGSIGFDPNRRGGALFWVEIPFQLASSSADTLQRLPRGAMQVVCVDKSPHVRRILKTLLESWGAKVITAETAAEIPAGQACDLILIEAGGAYHTLFERFPMTPAILLVPPQDWIGRSVLPNSSLYLHKPIRQAALWNCLLRALGTPSMAREAQAPIVPEPPIGARVLVAEDNVLNQKLILQFLKRLGCQATVAENGRVAVDLALRQTFDLILMDYQMPVLDGVDAAREIREREPASRRTPIIGLTAATLPEDQQRCRDAGMDGFIGKPVAFDSLREVIQTHAPNLERR